MQVDDIDTERNEWTTTKRKMENEIMILKAQIERERMEKAEMQVEMQRKIDNLKENLSSETESANLWQRDWSNAKTENNKQKRQVESLKTELNAYEKVKQICRRRLGGKGEINMTRRADETHDAGPSAMSWTNSPHILQRPEKREGYSRMASRGAERYTSILHDAGPIRERCPRMGGICISVD
ncbi:hypothetical protein CC80DRAFT_104840 [Byssothecium circinans]|uniref:Uncharacterized protein n=1 Tax=Byssothecium circinans TaxID=147558 RepID=A0A6A5UGJ2_9PLEO|nr:hypothetical protein CC80DRAFT_104840 [Byssothecium circinans]